MIDLERLLADINLNQKELATLVGVTAQSVTHVKKSKMDFPKEWKKTINDKFQINVDDYEIIIANEPETKYIPKSEAVQKDDSEFMEVAYLPRYAQAGYLDSIQDESIPDVETKLVPKEYEKGNYLIVEITGDSMDDGSKRSIMDGDSVLIKELQRIHWSNKLHFKQYLFVIMSREGVVCKQITAHNVETGIITCHSWNELYKDYDLDLRDVFKIFYIKKIIDRKIKF